MCRADKGFGWHCLATLSAPKVEMKLGSHQSSLVIQGNSRDLEGDNDGIDCRSVGDLVEGFFPTEEWYPVSYGRESVGSSRSRTGLVARLKSVPPCLILNEEFVIRAV